MFDLQSDFQCAPYCHSIIIRIQTNLQPLPFQRETKAKDITKIQRSVKNNQTISLGRKDTKDFPTKHASQYQYSDSFSMNSLLVVKTHVKHDMLRISNFSSCNVTGK